ncbi:cell division protein FtsL [Hydrogenophaga crassostreae]|uniref:Cell division protein FtsL n=1 Tax=Hydrogenophaga crassostreae TaxID=1763535 RepID=A0A167HN83_9BURK|nr:cell division protein FtsL [Hydrogenophaga crassostreae]AOW14919.1 cell division protein FtsL [Hydrogenophaga crassostreae]OAD41486.1 cell division protein FtsL [Hydrogenophaga crassostreae]
MIRLNLALLLVVMVSAFYLVHTQYESRRLYTAVDRANAASRKLESEHEQLRVLKREQATSARVQQLATNKLAMRPVSPGITQYVTMVSGAPVAASAPEPKETP